MSYRFILEEHHELLTIFVSVGKFVVLVLVGGLVEKITGSDFSF